MTHPETPGARRLALVSLVVGLALLALTVAIGAVGLAVPETTPPCPFVKGVLCAEFPPDGATFADALAPTFNPLGAWRAVVWLDMPFLIAYATLLSLATLAVAARRPGPSRRARWGVVALFVLGAALDVVENIGILSAVGDVASGGVPSDALAALTRTAATAKFAALGLGGLGLAALTWRARLALPWRLAYTAGGAIAALGTAGAVAPRLFELGALGIAVACATAIVDAGWRLKRPGVARP